MPFRSSGHKVAQRERETSFTFALEALAELRTASAPG
jgi:hypothetical protein